MIFVFKDESYVSRIELSRKGARQASSSGSRQRSLYGAVRTMEKTTTNARCAASPLEEDSLRFSCRDIGSYNAEYDRDHGSLRLSWSGAQRFLTRDETSGLLAFLQEVNFGSSGCVLCGHETVPAGQHCERCQIFLSYIHCGVHLLDAASPGWHLSSHLSLDSLDMRYHGTCLLSQLFGSFEAGIVRLDLGPLLIERDLDQCIGSDSFGWEQGYSLSPMTPPERIDEDYACLTALWIQVIAKKRLASSLAKKER